MNMLKMIHYSYQFDVVLHIVSPYVKWCAVYDTRMMKNVVVLAYTCVIRNRRSGYCF